MQILYSVEISNSMEVLWEQLSSFEGIEKYLPIITKSKIEGEGVGSKRISEINLRNQVYLMQETLQNLDETKHTFTTSLDDGPIQIKGMNFTFSLNPTGKNKTNLTISTNVTNPDSQIIAKNFFEMIGQGLKKLHEL